MKTKILLLIFILGLSCYSTLVLAQLMPELVLPVGHTRMVYSAEFSPDGKYIVTASLDNTAKIWDTESGRLLHSLDEHTDGVEHATYSPDGKTIATASYDKTAKIWDSETGQLLQSLEGHTKSINSATYSPDGKTIVTASNDNTVKIWDSETGKILHSFDAHIYGISSVTYSLDGKTILMASAFAPVKIWDFETGSLLHSLDGNPSGNITNATYSPNNKTIITASHDSTAKIWDAETGKLLHSLDGHNGFVSFAIYNPDGETILTFSTDDRAKLWDSRTSSILYSFRINHHTNRFATYSPDGKNFVMGNMWNRNTADVIVNENGHLLCRLNGHTDGVISATYSPDGKTIVTASYDGTAKIWNSETGQLLHSLDGHNYQVDFATYSPNGKTIVMTSKDNIPKILDSETGSLLHFLDGHTDDVLSARYSPDSKTIVTASKDNTAKIWNSETGTLLYSLDKHSWDVFSATYSTDGKTIVTGSYDGTAKIWNSETGTLLNSIECVSGVFNYATCSPDGKTIVMPNVIFKKGAVIRNSETGKLLHSLKKHQGWSINDATYSPDGKTIVTASKAGFKYSRNDNTATIWDSRTGKLLHNLKGHSSSVKYVTYSPDGKTIVTVSSSDIAKIWDSRTGKLLHNLDIHTDYINYATYSPDGKTIVTASDDNTVKIWDSKTSSLLHSMERHTNDVNYATYSPDGKTIITASDDCSIIIWDTQTGKMLVQQFNFGSKETVTLTENGLFDATPGAMEQLYFVQGLEIIELNQLKDRYWEPDLWRKAMAGEELRNVTGFNEALPLSPKVENLVINNEAIDFDLIDNNGGIGKYYIYINRKEAFVGNKQKNGEVYKDSILKVTYSFKNHEYLLPGDSNKITVKAYNAENWIISRGANVLYSNKKKETEISKPNIFIVSCGVSDYTGNQIDLRYAAKDAEDISKSLQLGAEQLFGSSKTFQYLLSTNGEKEKWPTKKNIEKVFKEISKKAKSIDIIVVYLSGHGINWGGQDGDFYYLTQDAYTASGDAYNDPAIRKASTLSSNELVELFKLVPANKQVLIIDACASGQVVEDLLAQRDISSSTIRALDRMKDRTGMYIITGSAADAVSYEASKYGQGLLTYSLLEGIKGAALREGQFIDVDVLFQRAKDRVPQLAEGIGGIQQPQVFFPYGSASFDIGLLTEKEKEKIPLAKEKPVFVMSTFMDADSFDDVLGLENLVDEELRTVSAKGSDASLIFYETKNFPEAYRLRGQYSISGNEITLNLKIFYGKEEIESVEIRGDKDEMERFVSKVIEKASTGTN